MAVLPGLRRNVTAGEDAPHGRNPRKRGNRLPYTFAIARSGRWKGRALGSCCAKRKIVSQYGVAGFGECARHHLQQRRIAIGTGSHASAQKASPLG